MPESVNVPVAIEETEQPRFGARYIAWFGVLAVVVVGVLFFVLAAATNVFDSTITHAGPDGKQVVESTFELATAKFAIAALLVFGALTVLAGVLVELADMKVKTRHTGATAEVPAGEVVAESVAATGAAALGVAVGEIFKSLGSALKGLRASGALLLTGAGMMVTAGLVAWNTIPDTDRSPTIEVTSSTGPNETSPETTPPDTAVPGTSASPPTTVVSTTGAP